MQAKSCWLQAEMVWRRSSIRIWQDRWLSPLLGEMVWSPVKELYEHAAVLSICSQTMKFWSGPYSLLLKLNRSFSCLSVVTLASGHIILERYKKNGPLAVRSA